jgi:hypothetical protein
MRHVGTLPSSACELAIAAPRGLGILTAELVEAAADAALALGLSCRIVGPGDGTHGQVLLGINCPPGLADILAASRADRRIVWFGEPVPGSPEVLGGGSTTKPRLFEAGRRISAALPRSGPTRWLVGLGGRVADQEPWGNLRSAVRLASLSDVFVTSSRDVSASMAAAGIETRAVPFGYSPRQHGPLHGDGNRDVDFLVLGGTSGPRSRRRRRHIDSWRRRGFAPAIAEGVWGEERNSLLRRTRVLVEAHRFPGTYIGIRLILALAAGAAVVSEPMKDPHPFASGIHFVEAAGDDVPEAARELLADEPRRRRIVAAGQTLLAEELAMSRCLARVLDGALLSRS